MVKPVLIAVRKRIEDPAHWTQDAIARSNSGVALICLPDSEATCWCLMGALMVEASNMKEFNAAREKLRETTKTYWVSRFNDNHTHQEVLNVLDQAIASCN